MNHRIAKTTILSTCLQKQQELIDHFNQRVEDVKAEAYNNNETPSQTDEGSNSPEEFLQTLGQELDFVTAEMEILRSIDPANVATEVERGAVVLTNHRTFFIGVSSEEIEIDGQKIFGMSDHAPLYAFMRGLRKGDSFEYNKTKYEIKDIY
jgi:hypothetical protein